MILAGLVCGKRTVLGLLSIVRRGLLSIVRERGGGGGADNPPHRVRRRSYVNYRIPSRCWANIFSDFP